jgi:hypothetical protein
VRCFVGHCLSLCPLSLGYCIVCLFSIYDFRLPIWYLQTCLTGSFWLGGADDIVEKDWRWVASEVHFNFTDWGPKQPDDAGKK